MQEIDIDKPFTGRVMTASGNVGTGKNCFAIALIRMLSNKCIHKIRIEQPCPYCVKYGITQEERVLKAYSNFHIGLTAEAIEAQKDKPYRKIFPKNYAKKAKENPNLSWIPIQNLVTKQWYFVECEFLPNVIAFLILPKSKQHSICIIDEPNAWGFDSRGSGSSEQNKAIGYKIQHTRHYNRDIVFLTQLWSMVDLRGKRLSSDSVLAVSPEAKEFQYGIFKFDSIIPLSIRKSYARNCLFPYYDSSEIIGQEYSEEQEEEPKIEQKETFPVNR